jgi:hypothetical protein
MIGIGFLAPYFLAGSLYAQALVEDYNAKGFKTDFPVYESRGKSEIYLMRGTPIGIESELFCKEGKGCACRLIAPNGNTFAWVKLDSRGSFEYALVAEGCEGEKFTKRYRGSDNFPVPECAVAAEE